MKNFSQDSCSSGWYLNLAPPEYKAEGLPILLSLGTCGSQPKFSLTYRSVGIVYQYKN